MPALTHPIDVLGQIEQRFSYFEPDVDSSMLKTAKLTHIFTAEQQHQKNQVHIAAEFSAQYNIDVLLINMIL